MQGKRTTRLAVFEAQDCVKKLWQAAAPAVNEKCGLSLEVEVCAC